MATVESTWQRPSIDDGTTETRTLSKREYEKELERLQMELVRLQEWIVHAGLRVVVIFEGRDTAGKGGTIKRITATTEPARLPRRGPRRRRPSASARSGTSSATSAHLPAAGEMVLFDRSWYNRAGVERVMGFCTRRRVRGVHAHVPAVRARCWCAPGSSSSSTGSRSATRSRSAASWRASRTRASGGSSARWTSRRAPRWVDYSEAKDEMFALHRHHGGAVVRRRGRRQARGAPEPDQPSPQR